MSIICDALYRDLYRTLLTIRTVNPCNHGHDPGPASKLMTGHHSRMKLADNHRRFQSADPIVELAV